MKKKKPSIEEVEEESSDGNHDCDSTSSEESPRFDRLRHRKLAHVIQIDHPSGFDEGVPRSIKHRRKSSRLKSMKRLVQGMDGEETLSHPSGARREDSDKEKSSKDSFKVSIKVKAQHPSIRNKDKVINCPSVIPEEGAEPTQKGSSNALPQERRRASHEEKRPSVLPGTQRRSSLADSAYIRKQLQNIPEMVLLRPPSQESVSAKVLLEPSDDDTLASQTPGTASPRVSPKSSPKISPRLVAAHMKRKFSEAILLKPEALSFMSDQMVSVSFKSLESFVTEDNLSGLQGFLSSRSVVIDDRDENGTTALILSASKGRADFCRELLDHGADVNAEDNDQWTSLITASKEGHEETVQALLDHGANIEHRDIGGWTALMWACYKGNLGVSRILLAHGADPNAQGQHHMTSLVWAAGRGHLEIVSDLLSKGAKVNLGDKFGTTPLIWACRKGYFEIVETLLRHGANVDATGMYSWTPLLVATKGNYLELVHIILEQKPNVNALDKDGGTALTIACKEGFSEIASALLRSGAYVNIQDRNGDTNLIYASRGGHRSVVESLLKRHADTDMVGKDKKTALYWAVEKGHTPVVKMLLSSNADLEHTTKEGDTALLRAVRTKNAEIVQLLIDRKARVTCADKKGDTALHIAMRGRSKRIVEILLRNPKNSQMLYRPNRAGETPYNIDLSNQKTILGQIFGARRLNTNEENENMLGYDLYSSSLADILSEPSLSMPISVGLYARWGSGKSFLVRKLKEEMNSFARQWVEPLFQFTPLVFLLCVIISTIVGFITLLSSSMWYVGAATGACLFTLLILILLSVWYGSRSKYDWHLCYRWSVSLASQMSSFKLVMQVIFCSPPGDQWKEWKGGVHEAKPLKFIFAEGAKPSSTGAGGNSAVQILGSLFDMIENQYGIFSTRFYRAFRPKAQGQTSPWRYRRLCGVPYIAIFFITLLCALALTYLAVTYGFHGVSGAPSSVSATPSPVLVKDVVSERTRELDREFERAKRAAENLFGEFDDDDDDDDDDDEEEEDKIVLNDGAGFAYETEEKEEEERVVGGEFGHGKLINPLLFILSALVALVVVANIHTLARMVRALIFSHKRHLLSSIAKFDTVNAEGYLPTLKSETSLMIDMVRCLDAFTSQQTRLVVILDGLDTCEQEKVLSVLDAVHSLFTDSSGPFIILLAIDPHIITRAIEFNATKLFRESSISGHDYLRNIIHLPFYLQNAGLRKVKQAEQAAENIRGRSQSVWNEQETEVVSLATTSAMGGLHHMPPNRRLSAESGRSLARRNTSKGSRRLKQSDSIGSSIASNLHRVSAASDLNKVLLTDDYFNDINPRSMRRLMNVVYIAGRLLKAFHIEFNWYHLALWVNITEQWPYRASWLIHHYEKNEDSVEEKSNLKDLYDRVKNRVPNSKENEPLLEMDKDEKKFETFLAMHESVLHVYNLVIFLPFTINLDPFIKKKIKEEELQLEETCPSSTKLSLPWHLSSHDYQSRSSTLSNRGKGPFSAQKQFSSTLPPTMNPLMWGGYGGPFFPSQMPSGGIGFNPQPPLMPAHIPTDALPTEAQDKKLSSLSINDIFELFKRVDGVSTDMLPSYQEKLSSNNINGKVLLHCNLDDLKHILSMTFGDWELFKMLILGLREIELSGDEDLGLSCMNGPQNVFPNTGSLSDHSEGDSTAFKRGSIRSSKEKEDPTNYHNRRPTKHNLHAKQVTLEEQMIFGALQTLNEEAFEDVVEEQAKNDALTASYHLAALKEDESFNSGPKEGRLSRRGSKFTDELDVVYLQSSPLLPHTVVSCPPDEESTGQSLASSFSPYKGSTSLSRASSFRDSTSTSPKHSAEEHQPPSLFPKYDSKDSSPFKKVLFSSGSPSPIKRQRPQSLNLNHHHDSEERLRSLSLAESPNNICDDLVESATAGHYHRNGPEHASLVDHHTSGSSASMDRLKKLTKRLQKAFGSQETNVSPPTPNDPEASPLVFASPSSTTSIVAHSAETVTPAYAGMVNGATRLDEHPQDGDQKPIISKVTVTSRTSSFDEKETNV